VGVARPLLFLLVDTRVRPELARPIRNRREPAMLSASITFLIIAIVAAILGFGFIAGTAASIAKILFVVFLILFLVSLVTGRKRSLG
jgi:uncharacterized membrane protein YtjA (UPF0391 family)